MDKRLCVCIDCKDTIEHFGKRGMVSRRCAICKKKHLNMLHTSYMGKKRQKESVEHEIVD